MSGSWRELRARIARQEAKIERLTAALQEIQAKPALAWSIALRTLEHPTIAAAPQPEKDAPKGE
jgi:hypothetical protein